MTEITGRVFPFTGDERSEAQGIKDSYKALLCFQGRFFFFCPVITENYGYQVATFDALTTSGFFQEKLCRRFV